MQIYNSYKAIFTAFLLLFSVNAAQATTILMDNQYLNPSYAYTGAGGTGWTNFSNALDSASAGNVSVGNFSNLSYMMGFDAIFVNLRCSTCTLNATEYTNISSYIAAGGKAVIIGENTNWTAWDNQILGMVGGTFSGTYYSGVTSSISGHELVNGVSSVNLPAGGIVATGGEALFDHNFATLWGSNVLTVLDVNIMSDSYWGQANNGQFATNIATWISTTAAVPESGSLALMFAGLTLLVVSRKSKTGKIA